MAILIDATLTKKVGTAHETSLKKKWVPQATIQQQTPTAKSQDDPNSSYTFAALAPVSARHVTAGT